MKSLNKIGTSPASLPLSADDIVEFHAARLLLLLSICGTSGRIDGLTKMAKLDFFARYPEFFFTARDAISPHNQNVERRDQEYYESIESAMVRHHYGPWDKRYYHVLAYLEGKCLITVSKEKKYYRIKLTDLGRNRAEALEKRSSFVSIIERMKEVKVTFGAKSGMYLKNLIYSLFDKEICRRPLGEVIE